MAGPDVLFALTGNVRHNSRALRQLELLASMDVRVKVLTFGAPEEDVLQPGITPHRVARPSGGGARFFARLHARMRDAASKCPAHVYHASDLYVLPALHAAAKRHTGQLAYDARECYPHVAATAGRPWVRRFWQALESFYVQRVDAAFTVSESIASHMAATYGIPEPVVLYNAPHERASTTSRTLHAWAGLAPEIPLLLHQGRMAPDRGCERLIEAMPGVRNCALAFLGSGSLRPQLERRVEELGLVGRVFFFDPVPPGDLLTVTASADAGITLLQDTCLNHRYALPNKLFEYLCAGLPVLGSDLPEIRRVIRGHDVGIVVDPSDPTALVEALQRMANDGTARRVWSEHTPAALETFSSQRSSNRFRHVYDDLLRQACP